MLIKNAFLIDVTTIEAASRCEKGQQCLEGQPKCAVSADVSAAEALIVHCEEIGPCAYKTGTYRTGNGMESAVCSCPVRIEFYRRHGV